MALCLRLCTVGEKVSALTLFSWVCNINSLNKCCLSAQRKIQIARWNHPRDTIFYIYMLAVKPLYTVSSPALSLSTLLGIWKYFSCKDHYQESGFIFHLFWIPIIHSITASQFFPAPVLIPNSNLLMRGSYSTPQTITSKYQCHFIFSLTYLLHLGTSLATTTLNNKFKLLAKRSDILQSWWLL